ncbi:tetratricopeptide repeat protein [Ideonella sp. BN130291]|uniref:tetratricopeptide repeat protein n=1 Tax=Ideonella sp. BN130291 TaxID=3112940 RepID=UPI002E26A58D|nr:tetratricopeptide repeat protein [Ideonella sp. BN130291]
MEVTHNLALPLDLEAALQRVLDSECFAGSPRQQRFLRHLVAGAHGGQAPALKESVLAIEVFGRHPARFDPKEDTIVRVEARRLRQRLARYYAQTGASDPWEISLPVGSYVPTLRRRGAAPHAAGSRHARDLVERGDHFLREGAFPAALQRYQEALRECSRYAPAYVGAARAWVNLGMSGLEPAAPHIDHALEALGRALELDPALPEAASLKGLVLHRFEHDWPAAQHELARAVALAPGNARVRDLYGFQLMFAGLLDEAEAQLRRARELDPQNPAFRLHMAWLRVAQRRWADADKEYLALLDIAPDNFWALLSRADMLLYCGRHGDAITLYREARRRCPGHADCQLGEACALYALGRPEEAGRLLQPAAHTAPAPSPYVMAEVMAASRRYDDALALLQRSAAVRDPLFLAGATSPLFEPMYGDERLQALYRSARAQPLATA